VCLAVGEWGAEPESINPLEMESPVKNLLKRLFQEEAGQDVIEYALLAAGISIVIIPIAPDIGEQLVTVYGNILTAVTDLAG